MEHKAINWQDPMAVSARHFIESDNHFIEMAHDVAKNQLTNSNFGLLAVQRENNSQNNIRVSEHITDRIEVQVYNCNAVTSSGSRIQFNGGNNGAPLIKNYSPSEDKNIKNRNADSWDIIISVDPFDRQPIGAFDPEETPPRHPYCESKYSLYVMATGEINAQEFGGHYLIIGRIKKESGRYTVNHQYIPPSTCMLAHPELMDYYERFSLYFNELEKSSRQIIEKIQGRSNNVDLALNIQAMCTGMLDYISMIYFSFRNEGRYYTPVRVVNCIASLAHKCYISLISMKSTHKEEVLKYFYEWNDIKPGEFEESLSNTLEIIYEHDKIRSVMVQSEIFLQMLTSLWVKLSKLEYIGQRKENIVVSERVQSSESGGRNSWLIE